MMVSPFRGCWRPSPSPVLRKTRVSPEDSLRWGRRCPVSACVGSWAGLEGKPVFSSPVGQRIMATLELPAHGWGGKNGEKGRKFGMVTYTQLCLKWRTNEDLLLSTGNSAQAHAQHGWERSLGRTHPCACMAESLGCPLETMTTLFIGYTPVPSEKFTLEKWKSSSCLCCPGGPCSLPALVHEFAPPDPGSPVHPPSPASWQPQASSLHLRVCFCFADEFVCIRF